MPSGGMSQYSDIAGRNGTADLMPHVQDFQPGQQHNGDGSEARKVVVLGVPWQTEDSTLLNHFSEYGTVEEAQIMRERYTGKSRGFGFVTFATAEEAQRAIVTDHIIDGRRCEAKFALPEGKVGSARTTRIFVARIPSSVNDAEFRGYFEQFGAVQDAYMPKDPSKQGHRGIGFVTYASAESVERVMAGTHVLNGNEVAIDRATPKERAVGAMLPGRLSMSQPNLHMLAVGGSAHGGTAFGFMRGGIVPGGPPRLDGSSGTGGVGLGSRHMSHPVLSSGQFGTSPQSARGSVSNFAAAGSAGYNNSAANLQALAQAQAQAQAQVQKAQAALQHHLSSSSLSSLDGSGAPTAEQQQQLINLITATNVAALGSSPAAAGGNVLHHSGSTGHFPHSGASSASDLTAMMPQQQQQPPTQQQQLPSDGNHHLPPPHQRPPHMAGWMGGAPGPHPHPYPNHRSFPPPQQPTIMGPPSARAGPRIFVGKLNRETSDQDVKEYFSRFGYVLDVYLPRDKANKREHRGFGFVTFETEASIQRVVSHGPHHIKGSVVAIDSAVPRQEEMGMAMDPAAMAAAAGVAGPAMVPSQPMPVPVPRQQSAGSSQAEALQAFEGLSIGDGNTVGSGGH